MISTHLQSNSTLLRQVYVQIIPLLEKCGKRIHPDEGVRILEIFGQAPASSDVAIYLANFLRQKYPEYSLEFYRDVLDTSSAIRDANNARKSLSKAQFLPTSSPTTSNQGKPSVFAQVLQEPVHLSYSIGALHFLSEKAINSIEPAWLNLAHETETSPALVKAAEQDLVDFIRARAMELLPRGQLIVSFMVADADGQRNSMLGNFVKAAQRLLERGGLTQQQYQQLCLPLYLRTDAEVNKALAGVKDLMYVQDYQEKWVRVPAWHMFEEGTISREAYARACVGVVSGLTRDWLESMVSKELTLQLEKEWRKAVEERPEEGKFRFAFLRLEKL